MIKLFNDKKFLLSWEILRKEPATRSFDWSFAPIPTFEEKFARYHHCGPPPEFPLASSYAGIVHDLSGPIRCALTQFLHHSPFCKGNHEIWIGLWCGISKQPFGCNQLFPHFHLHFALCFDLVCLSIILAHMLDSLVRVSRRVIWRPLLPKHLQPCVSPTTRKICFEALNYV